jgi:hypothetical protein
MTNVPAKCATADVSGMPGIAVRSRSKTMAH